MIRSVGFLSLLSLMACNPQSAELLGGSFTMFVSKNTSMVEGEGKIDMSGFEEAWNIDCRVLDNEELRLEDPLDICNGSDGGVGSADYVGPGPDEETGTDDDDNIAHEAWANLDAYRVAQETLNAWRGEAIMTSEGDFQLTFHHRLNGGEDFRFAIVVDPTFEPRRCVQNEDGSVAWEDIDGDWIGAWSEHLADDRFSGSGSSGTLIALNSGAYQFNPSDTEDYWGLPQEWEAGYTLARWGPENMYMRTARYGMPAAYAKFELDDAEVSESDLFYVSLEKDEDASANSGYQELIERTYAVSNEIGGTPESGVSELGLLGVTTNYAPVVLTNEWRQSDGFPVGMDGWTSLNYNWIRIDQSRDDLVVGGAVSGEFRLVYEGADSQSRLLVQGEFNVDKIRKDTWTVDEVQPEKLEENNTVLCGEEYGTGEE